MNMNPEVTLSDERNESRKTYHEPKLTMLGPVQSVVRAGHAGPGGDPNPSNVASAGS
jgi:hypothetical protein